jgi:hypothetical protein
MNYRRLHFLDDSSFMLNEDSFDADMIRTDRSVSLHEDFPVGGLDDSAKAWAFKDFFQSDK